VRPSAAVREGDGWAADRREAWRGHGADLDTLGPGMDRATY
jgi:hypothetical protein